MKKILIGIAGLILLLIVYVALQSPHYKIEREIVINASESTIFPHLNNSVKLNTWMPWKDIDKEMTLSYAGPEEGIGSITKWESPGDMGTGQAEIIESTPNQSVKTKIVYSKPSEFKQESMMTLSPVSGGTLVKWSAYGEHNFIGRFFCLFMNMDKFVGGEFSKGLLKLKNIVEKK